MPHASRADRRPAFWGVSLAVLLVALGVLALLPAPAAQAGSTRQPAPAVVVVQTDGALSQHMARQRALTLSAVRPKGVAVIAVNEQTRYQRFAGIGAAMTDSSAWLIHDALSPAARGALMRELFGSAGIHLNFLRVPMGASDFTVAAKPYTYDDTARGQADPSLSHFSIAHDLKYILPTLRQALTINRGLQILANPWTPPAWMKGNLGLDNVGGRGTLRRSAYAPLASYFVRFIRAYASSGVPVDAVTPQNEPSSGGGGTTYAGLTLPVGPETSFIAHDLAPALRLAGLSMGIYGLDSGWNERSYAGTLASDPATRDLAGIAWHCYFGSPSAMSRVHRNAPALDQIVDECSPEIRSFGAPEFLISSLRNWASKVALWNVALDRRGGPVEPTNGCPGCRGVVTIDEHAHTVSRGAEYYQLGQVSAFVQPGATRIDSPHFVSYGVDSTNVETITLGLDDVAFLNPDGSRVLVVYNHTATRQAFAVKSDGRYFTYRIPPGAMTTFVWRGRSGPSGP